MRKLLDWIKSFFVTEEPAHAQGIVDDYDIEAWTRYFPENARDYQEFKAQKERILHETKGAQNAWPSAYLRENCCSHFAALQEACPFHPRDEK